MLCCRIPSSVKVDIFRLSYFNSTDSYIIVWVGNKKLMISLKATNQNKIIAKYFKAINYFQFVLKLSNETYSRQRKNDNLKKNIASFYVYVLFINFILILPSIPQSVAIRCTKKDPKWRSNRLSMKVSDLVLLFCLFALWLSHRKTPTFVKEKIRSEKWAHYRLHFLYNLLAIHFLSPLGCPFYQCQILRHFIIGISWYKNECRSHQIFPLDICFLNYFVI